jgi:hypothetical protein
VVGKTKCTGEISSGILISSRDLTVDSACYIVLTTQ